MLKFSIIFILILHSVLSIPQCEFDNKNYIQIHKKDNTFICIRCKDGVGTLIQCPSGIKSITKK